MTPSKLQPALLGGIVMGVLSALPFVSMGNCCCLWVVGGGLIAAYILQQNHPLPITAGDGAAVGLLAGIIGAIVSTVLSVPISMAMGPMQERLMRRVLENVTDLPPEARDVIHTWSSQAGTVVQAVVAFVVMLFLGMLFSTLGGILGAVIFRRVAPPAAERAVDAPPPT